jgi:hypothetical protein
LLSALRFFVASLRDCTRLLGALNASLSPVSLQKLPIWTLNAGERSGHFAADAGINRLVSGAHPHVVSRFLLTAGTTTGHGAEVKHARIARSRVDHLGKLSFRVIILAGEISVYAAAVDLRHFGSRLGRGGRWAPDRNRQRKDQGKERESDWPVA